MKTVLTILGAAAVSVGVVAILHRVAIGRRILGF
jgi:hypothetical protein